MENHIIRDQLFYHGRLFELEYHDADSFDHLPLKLCHQSYGVCFYNDQLLIAHNGSKNTWGLVGGTVEPGETPEAALIREIQEESNMQLVRSRPLGYQQVTSQEGRVDYQLRYVCLVKPFGDFITDPAGSVTAIKLISPLAYHDYFDWGPIGDRIIQRALELEKHLK